MVRDREKCVCWHKFCFQYADSQQFSLQIDSFTCCDDGTLFRWRIRWPTDAWQFRILIDRRVFQSSNTNIVYGCRLRQSNTLRDILLQQITISAMILNYEPVLWSAHLAYLVVIITGAIAPSTIFCRQMQFRNNTSCSILRSFGNIIYTSMKHWT